MKNRIKYIALVLAALFVAQAAVAQCWLPANKQTVNALAGTTVTLGVPDPNNGRTACYRWTENSLLTGDLSEPTQQVVVPSTPGSSYTFHVKKISDRVQTCTITLTVRDTLVIVSIDPIPQCWTDGDDISESQFNIVTDPPYMDNYVHLQNDSKKASFPSEGWNLNWEAQTTDEVTQTLRFEAVKNGQVLDNKTCQITVYKGEPFANIELNADVTSLVNKLQRMSTFATNMTNYAATVTDKLKSWMPKLSFSIDSSNFNAGVRGGNHVCCNGLRDRYSYTLYFNGGVGVKAHAGVPVNKFGTAYPPLLTLPPQLQLVFNMSLGVSAQAEPSFNSCGDFKLDIGMGAQLTLAGGIAWGEEDDWLYGAAQIYLSPSFNATLHAYPWDGLELALAAEVGLDISGHIKAGWFKGSASKKFVIGKISGSKKIGA